MAQSRKIGKLVGFGLAAGITVAASLGTVTPAFARASFSGSDGYASWKYDDGADSFCVTSINGQVSVRLSPVTSGRGPSYNQLLSDKQKKCFSLATAYEDSQYNWYVGTRGAGNQGKFYS